MKIAIIGAGISGLGAAYLLKDAYDVTLYEAEDRLGGHARTVQAEGVAVDTGFIVFNHHNYPHLTAMFKQLEVPTCKSDMSFGVSIDNGWLEYGSKSLATLFAQKRNLLRPEFLKMVRNILRFNKDARRYLDAEPELTLGQVMNLLGMGEWFKQYFLLAMGGAIWSTPLEDMLAFPACTFLRFFDNHGLLSVEGQPQWYSVIGGSTQYVQRIAETLPDIRLNSPIATVERKEGGVDVTTIQRHTERYDHIIFASHPDQTLHMLQQPTEQEQQLLRSFTYQPNEVVLHSDTSFMPKCRKAWSSWVYLCEGRHDNNPKVSLSYWMNNLQQLDTDNTIIVTMNPGREPDPSLVYNRHQFAHPLFNEAAIKAQSAMSDIQGEGGVWHTGAWQRYGFHEDGLLSAVNVAQKLGVTPSWS